MSLVPYLLNELLDDYDPYRVYDQHFGMGLFNNDLHRPRHRSMNIAPLRLGYIRPMRSLVPEESGVSTISNDKDQFKVNLDVQQFKPEEVNVKVVDDYLVVDGKHEERKDNHGFISRQFTRRYKLPENVNLDAITSNISSDGVLSIAAPKKVAAISGNERSIPILKTNQPALKQSAGGKGEQEKMEQ